MLIKYPNATQLVSEPRFELQLQSFLTPEPVFFTPAQQSWVPGTWDTWTTPECAALSSKGYLNFKEYF